LRKIKAVFTIAAVAGGILASLPAFAGAANASVYSVSWIDRCAQTNAEAASHDDVNDCIQLGSYATYTQTQVWINGSVFCHPYGQGSVSYSWCGLAGGNGTGAINIAVNFTMSGITGLYERMNIFAGGSTEFGGDGPGCGTYGSNSDTNGINHWWNDDSGPTPRGLLPGGGVNCEYPV
jgi:hypothetical protein